MDQNENIRVLLVEDDPDDYVLFKYSLNEIKNNSYTLTWASNYDAALEIIKKREHDIYFFDYLLGARTGLDLIQESIDEGVDAPIIILTGLGNQQTDMKAMELGAADYLVKGEIDTEKLERSIRYSIEQHRMLNKLRDSETKFRSIFENSHDIIYLSTKEGKILDINEAAERLFGYSKQELLSLNAADLYENKTDRDKFIECMNETGNCQNFEVILLDKFRNKKYCTITANVQKDESGGELYYQGIIHDMTMRRKAEHDLMIAEKFAFVGKIARTLAHEVRNPLTNINLSVEQLEEFITDENLVIYFDIIKRNTKRINDLVTELLENSKQTQINRSSVPLQTVLQNTVELAKDRANLKNIHLVTDYRLSGESVLADESKLSIAFLNIIINAIEAVAKNTGEITISSFSEDNRCIIKIQDNGPGIPEDHLAKIFDPYFTSKANGMGLGLAATQNIISTHNGKIDIETQVDKGTIFTIQLEMVTATAAP